MLTIQETGGLAVAWHTKDTKQVERQLKALDPNLFLDPEFDPYTREVFWTVKYWNGERAPEPVSLVLQWRRPMSEAVVHEVQRMMQRGPLDVKEITAHNRALREQKREESAQQYREIVDDFVRHDAKRIMVPRSVGLRMARDKMRRRGENV